MNLDADRCYKACLSNDARFDGRFFAAVRTTGIYCRSICPAPMPKRENIVFYPSAAAAEQAGFRACRRCRPDASPGTPAWHGSSALVTRALRLIDAGALDEAGLPDLSRRLGIGERQLSRLFVRHLGTSPVAVAQTRRVHFAKRLLEETSMPMGQIAFASGFASVRRFNHLIRKSFDRSPSEIRRDRPGARVSGRDGHLDLRLTYRPPLDWSEILRTLTPRATPGVESIEGETYRRTVSHDGNTGVIEVRPSRGHSLSLRVIGPLSRSILPIAERVRDLFDLRCDAHTIRMCLISSRRLRSRLVRRPVPRVLGAWDGFETAVRIVLGQQVSVKGASTIAGRIAARYGEPIAEPRDGLRVLFPTPEALATASLDRCGLTGARVRAVRGLARGVCDGAIVLHPSSDPGEVRERLLGLPGIGRWTAETIVMRALGHPDAFPAGDLGLRKALAVNGSLPGERELLALSEAWRPWRAYAAMVLWRDPARQD